MVLHRFPSLSPVSSSNVVEERYIREEGERGFICLSAILRLTKEPSVISWHVFTNASFSSVSSLMDWSLLSDSWSRFLFLDLSS